LITKVADAAASHPPGLNARFRPDANICLAKAVLDRKSAVLRQCGMKAMGLAMPGGVARKR
jgi:hypothetical protein